MTRVGIGLIACSLAAVSACGGSGAPSEAQRIDARAAEVMPFDLDKTTHAFGKVSTSGVQTVVAIDPDDAEQVALIQGHLR